MAKHMAPTRRRTPIVGIALAVIAVLAVGGVACWLFFGRPMVGENSSRSSGGEGQSAQSVAGSSSVADDEAKKGNPVEQKDASGSELARMLSNGEVRSIRLVGDSITAGFGTDGYDEAVESAEEPRVIFNDGFDRYYETPASVNCWANAFREYALSHGVKDFTNAGINGAFMKELANKPDAWLGDGADVVFVALGTNDAGYYGTDEFRSDAQTGLSAAAKKSKVLVVLAPVRDLRPEYTLVEPAAELGDVLKSLCEENGYLFVDPRDAVKPQMFNADGLHPNSEGSLAIWQCIQQTLGL